MVQSAEVVSLQSPRNTRLDAQKTVSIHLVGSMRVLVPDGTNILPRSRKARALLAYLCLCNRTRASRTD